MSAFGLQLDNRRPRRRRAAAVTSGRRVRGMSPTSPGNVVSLRAEPAQRVDAPTLARRRRLTREPTIPVRLGTEAVDLAIDIVGREALYRGYDAGRGDVLGREQLIRALKAETEWQAAELEDANRLAVWALNRAAAVMEETGRSVGFETAFGAFSRERRRLGQHPAAILAEWHALQQDTTSKTDINADTAHFGHGGVRSLGKTGDEEDTDLEKARKKLLEDAKRTAEPYVPITEPESTDIETTGLSSPQHERLRRDIGRRERPQGEREP